MKSKTLPGFGDRVIQFNRGLKFKGLLPHGIRVLNPVENNAETGIAMAQFYKKFYNDRRTRHLILGINPARFGAGATGIPFTDTKRLTEQCGISIRSLETHEPSSVFVYDVIKAYGGVKRFFSDFYIGAVCPLGFTTTSRTGRQVNFNYYDSKSLMEAAYEFMVDCLRAQLDFGIARDVCICWGKGKNAAFLGKLNSDLQLFDRVIALDHPRFIMQYKFREKDRYVKSYVAALRSTAAGRTRSFR